MYYTANCDYEEKGTSPIRLQPGDRVQVGLADRVWPGWVWATDSAGHNGYVPEEILRQAEDGSHQVTEAFDPTVLAVKRGDRLVSLRQIHGWHWCRNDGGEHGWVAGYLMRPE